MKERARPSTKSKGYLSDSIHSDLDPDKHHAKVQMETASYSVDSLGLTIAQAAEAYGVDVEELAKFHERHEKVKPK